ncbi:tyrosine recombinase XerC [Lentibacter sp. XHP0401]|uniref:site-specific integrase n=1 Tax=Lentibacter sp. XHP0401 TaxID=2984334 RepID=UPI0021E8794A|nr:tyrosine-type recombinase/integrase [Lentibacter sp. XHP0401]
MHLILAIFDTNRRDFDTMSDEGKIPYLKIDRGRYFYQRRVPQKMQAHLGIRRWQLPCGDVSYSKAVQMVVTWAEEHDELIASLRDPDKLRKAGVTAVREAKAKRAVAFDEFDLPRFYEMTERLEGEKQYFPKHTIPRPWQAAAKMLQSAEAAYAGQPDQETNINTINFWIEETRRGDPPNRIKEVPRYPQLVKHIETLDPKLVRDAKIRLIDLPPPMAPELYLDWLVEAYDVGFGPDREPPVDADQKDEHDFIKRKLERKISELSPDPNTITAVTERYCDFNSIRSGTRSKYRRELARLIEITRDVPIGHVRTEHLRQLRDKLIGEIKPASIQAVFTPIKGIFNFAFDEDLINVNPMAGVKLPRDKRPIEERKWKPFEPAEIRRILDAAEATWGKPAKGLTDERRKAIHMVVRVLAFSGMRPVEVIRLTADDVDDKLIRIKGSKTESSTRVVPLHPELAGLHDWIANGGLTTFQTIKTDKVGSVRHNFARLLREQMRDPIKDPQKALYSLRSTFVNAMRRAGADIQVQRAILGHKEAGAIRHYDDGPEFDVKRRWVNATDPRVL